MVRNPVEKLAGDAPIILVCLMVAPVPIKTPKSGSLCGFFYYVFDIGSDSKWPKNCRHGSAWDPVEKLAWDAPNILVCPMVAPALVKTPKSANMCIFSAYFDLMQFNRLARNGSKPGGKVGRGCPDHFGVPDGCAGAS